MDLVRWNDSYSVKVQQFDAQHKNVLDMINDLAEAMRQGQSAAVVRPISALLMEHFCVHFTDEEDLMRRTGYSEFAAHQQEHGQYLVRLENLNINMEKAHRADSVTLLIILRDSILQHILQTDKSYSAHFIANGIH